MVPSAPGTVFRHEYIAGLGLPGTHIRGSPTGLEDLTPDVVPSWVARDDKYPMRGERKVGEL